MIDHGYWDYTRQNLNTFGITNKFFVNSVPKILTKIYGNHRDKILWLTVVSYTIISILYA